MAHELSTKRPWSGVLGPSSAARRIGDSQMLGVRQRTTDHGSRTNTHRRFFCAIVVLALCLSIGFLALRAQGETPYGIVASQNVMVTMRDGVRLATNIYRPG